MITNVHIELSDDERARVGAVVYGKPNPVTRKQVNEIVAMIFAQLLEDRHDVQPTQPCLGQPPAQSIPRHVRGGGTAKDGTGPARPTSSSYMRGWQQIGDAIARGLLK